MYCMYCGKQIPEESVFCIYCGKKMPDMNHSPAEPIRAGVPETEETLPGGYPVSGEALPGRASGSGVRERSNIRSLPERREEISLTDRYPDPYSMPTKNPPGIRGIYMFDFFARMLQRQNIPTLIYLFLNYLIVSAILMVFFGLPAGWALAAGFAVYAASVAVALSPIGELKLRTDCGCSKIMDPDLVRRLDPIFREVYYRAKKANPSISSDVRLYMNEDMSENAFATGRKTICITRGLLRRSDDEIRAILGHEFGHLANRDTDRILVVAVGNTFITMFFTFVEIGIWITDIFMNIVAIFSEDGIFIWLFSTISRLLSILFIRWILRLWSWIGCMLCMKTSRGNEYQADEFSWYLGYGQGLMHFFSSMHDGRPKGLFANLESSHPATDDRIGHLMELDAA